MATPFLAAKMKEVIRTCFHCITPGLVHGFQNGLVSQYQPQPGNQLTLAASIIQKHCKLF